jgi:hypothetical protein
VARPCYSHDAVESLTSCSIVYLNKARLGSAFAVRLAHRMPTGWITVS